MYVLHPAKWSRPGRGLADAAEGFIWRLQTEEGNATAIDFFGSDMIVNIFLPGELPQTA